MPRPNPTPLQHTILACVNATPGRLPPSGVAKLLAGTHSSRMADWRDHPDFGRLARLTRKELLSQIHILLQQGYLALDARGNVIPAPATPNPPT